MLSLFSGALVVIWTITLSIVATIKLCCKQTKYPQIRNLVIAYFISICLAVVVGALTAISNYVQTHPTFATLIGIFSSIIWFTAINSYYFTFLLRLKVSFEGSFYALTNTTLYSHYFIIGMTDISVLISYTASALKVHSPILSVFSAVGLFLVGIGIMHIVYAFNKRLYYLMLSSAKTPQLTEEQLALIDIITKQTYLFTLPFLSLWIAGIFSVLALLVLRSGDVAMLSVVVSVMVCTGCMLLTFNEFDAWYDRGCYHAHIAVMKCCQKYARRRMKKQQLKGLSVGNASTTAMSVEMTKTSRSISEDSKQATEELSV